MTHEVDDLEDHLNTDHGYGITDLMVMSYDEKKGLHMGLHSGSISEEMERRGEDNKDRITKALSDIGFERFSILSKSQHDLVISIRTEHDVTAFIDNLEGIRDTLQADGWIM